MGIASQQLVSLYAFLKKPWALGTESYNHEPARKPSVY